MEVLSRFEPLPAQWQFMNSSAKIRGYGGAMGGGKSRTLCEVVFDYLLDYPGLVAVVFRQEHTSIVKTTKVTMLEQVVPHELVAHKKASGGEDFFTLPNGSVCHFAGLDDPMRWYSAELGVIAFDEAQEIDEQAVLRLLTRLRQPGAPHKVLLSFNPANPGHWLQQWLILGASATPFGYRKDKLYTHSASRTPIGDTEFVFAKATDNVHLPDGYIEQALESLPPFLRRRYLEGLWEFIEGTCYFDEEALTGIQKELSRPLIVGRTVGELGGRVRFEPHSAGKWHVWKPPVREKRDPGTGETRRAHRYIVSVDVSSGAAADYSGVQILDVETLEQVAEYQDRIDPDLLAQEVFRAARVYNDALVAPEITGGYGHSLVRELERLRVLHRKPVKLYTRPVLDRLSKKFTDRIGWDTNTSTRFVMLDTLERLIRERALKLNSERTWLELTSFVRDEKGRPAAQPGMADDLVISLAIAVTVRERQPKQHRQRSERRQPMFASTGW